MEKGSSSGGGSSERQNQGENLDSREKQKDVRRNNIIAAKSICDVIRTSLGPRGMDKMIITDTGEVVITNDGATILNQMKVNHPAAKMLVELSKSQDIEAGDGTTSVVILAGSLLSQCMSLLDMGIHPTVISEAWQVACDQAMQVLRGMSTPVILTDRESLIKSANTSLSSKVVSQNSALLSPTAVDAVLRIIDPQADTNVDLRDIKVVKKLGGTVDDTELIDGLVFPKKASRAAGGPGRIENAKIGLVQFCISAPKTDMENQVIVNDFQQMDRILAEERKYIITMCKKIAKTGCNVLLIQKSILRDAVNDLSLHILGKLKIMVIKDIERTDVEHISKTLGCVPIAHVDAFSPEKLGHAALVESSETAEGSITRITGIQHPHRTISILVRGSNKLVIDEAERSIHDALCVIRCLVKERFLIAGGGAPETEISYQLNKFAQTLTGQESYCVRAFSQAMEVVPFTLAENAGLHPNEIVTELRKRHASGEPTTGINVRKGRITDMLEENVLQPLLVSTSAIRLATEYVRMMLKIDDIVMSR